MNNLTEKKSKKKYYVVIFSVLLSVMIASGYFYYKEYEKKTAILEKEKKEILSDLIRTKNSLKDVTLENKSLNDELQIEKQKVEALIGEIGDSNLDISTIIKYKSEITRLNNVVIILNKDKNKLKLSNQFYKSQRDSIILILGKAKMYKDSLSSIQNFIKTNNKINSNLSVVNFNTEPFLQKSDVSLVPITKAKKVNLIKISFLVQAKSKPKPTTKQYYIQIIDKKNNVLGLNKLKLFGNNELYYSLLIENKIDKELTQINDYVPVSDLKPGEYLAYVFDKDVLVSKSSFSLQ